MKPFIFSIAKLTCCFTIITLTLSGCRKTDLLSAKPQSNLALPSTIADYQALLENDGQSTGSGPFGVTPCLGNVSTDDYFVPDAAYPNLLVRDQNAYIWAPDIFGGVGNQADWNLPYKQIFYANVVVEGLNNIPVVTNNKTAWNNTYGNALFIRAFAYWNLAQVFVPVYDSLTANTEIGLPLKLKSDITDIQPRATVQQTYNQILQDLLSAVPLVANFSANNLNHASKPSVYAMLSRVYLSMRNYQKAFLYSDSSLRLYNTLIDYNTVSTSSVQPFTVTNAETIFQSLTINGAFTYGSKCVVDSVLFQSYSNVDLRGTIFFRTGTNLTRGFKYGYEGLFSGNPFSGLSSSEMYLIRAECSARAGNITDGMNDLNTLLVKRWKSGTFVPISASSVTDALGKILSERRKELVYRSLRWTDLRRLNKEGLNITIQRKLNGQFYTLLPNSPLYVLPIPPDEIVLSGLMQNQR